MERLKESFTQPIETGLLYREDRRQKRGFEKWKDSGC